MITLLITIIWITLAVMTEISVGQYYKYNRTPGSAFGYPVVGAFLCLAGGMFAGFLIYGTYFIANNFAGSMIWDIGTTILGTVFGVIAYIATLDIWFRNVVYQTIVAVQDPFGGFFPLRSGLVGDAPWLIKKPEWLIHTTSEIKLTLTVDLETSNEVVFEKVKIQVVCRVNEHYPMHYYELGDDEEDRQHTAEEAIELETQSAANQVSRQHTDDELLLNPRYIKEAVEHHLQCHETGCGQILTNMSLVFVRTSVGDFNRDEESAEAARLKNVARKQREAMDIIQEGKNIPDEMALNSVLAMSGQNTNRTVFSVEGLDKIDPAVARAFGAGIALTRKK